MLVSSVIDCTVAWQARARAQHLAMLVKTLLTALKCAPLTTSLHKDAKKRLVQHG